MSGLVLSVLVPSDGKAEEANSDGDNGDLKMYFTNVFFQG